MDNFVKLSFLRLKPEATLGLFAFGASVIAFNVRADVSKAVEKCAYVRQEVINKATVRAINRIADQAKTQASKDIREVGYNVKAAVIKKSISIRRASSGFLRAVVKANGRPIPLINFSARQTKQGVSVIVKEGRKLIPGAFIATMANGHTGVFERVGHTHRKNRKGQWSGLPIKQLFGPSVPSAFINETVQSSLLAMVREKFPVRFQHELDQLRLKG